jgi:hypothetical protein
MMNDGTNHSKSDVELVEGPFTIGSDPINLLRGRLSLIPRADELIYKRRGTHVSEARPDRIGAAAIGLGKILFRRDITSYSK